MKNTDFHADDYALSVNTSKDILNCIREGRLDSISFLPNMSCFDRCLSLWREEFREKKPPAVSIHLNFVEGRCLTASDGADCLADSDGYFKTSWKKLFFYSFSPQRKRVKKQLKAEIKAQIEKLQRILPPDLGLRIDSHQHTHMIPVVFDALLEVLRENRYDVEYIRCCRDFILPYFTQRSLLRSYRPINMVKVLVLNLLSLRAAWLLKGTGFNGMYLCGVFMSGKMNLYRVEKLFPSLLKAAEKHGKSLEILFHPGTLLKEEMERDFPDPDAVSFYLSKNRKTEYEAVMKNHLKE